MNPQLTKEFRTVLIPWSAAVATAILIALANFLIAVHVIEAGAFINSVIVVMDFTFLLSLLAIAAFPFGAEFQHRTFSLLLSQPVARSVIWRQKLLTSLVGIGIAVLVLILTGIVAEKRATAATKPRVVITTPIIPTPAQVYEPSIPGGMSREQAEVYQRRYGIRPEVYQRRYGIRPGIQSTQYQSHSSRPTEDEPSVWEICLIAGALLLPTLGSVTFWTLLARSTIGGMVFTGFSQLLTLGILAFLTERLGISEYRVGIRDLTAETFIFALASIIYGGIFFRLSWRKFSRLETSQLLPDALSGSQSLSARSLPLDWLRCRPTSGVINLIRKEIQLQNPLLIIAAILCVLWGVVYIFLISRSSHTTFPEMVFALTIGLYVPLMALLAGCVSLGEEKNLGITAWHLTFPVPVWRQWAVKLAVALAMWILLGFILPFALTRLGLLMKSPRLFNEVELKSWLAIFLFGTGLFALSFWAMTLLSNTVRAVLGSLAAGVAICGAATFACWVMADLIFRNTFLSLLISDSRWQGFVAWIVIGTVIVFVALAQSFSQFAQVQTSRKTIANYFSALLALSFFGTGCYYLSLPFSYCPPVPFLLLSALFLLIMRRGVLSVGRRALL